MLALAFDMFKLISKNNHRYVGAYGAMEEPNNAQVLD